MFTALLARLLYGETMDRRVWVAMALLLAGGMALVLDQGRQGGSQLWGLLAVLVATMAWGTDNTLSRALAERDPGQVVLGKAVLGTSATAILAVLMDEPLPTLGAALGLMAVGGLLMVLGVVMHLAESHGHKHAHEQLGHEHAHRHDNGHHNHTHDSMPMGTHSHSTCTNPWYMRIRMYRTFTTGTSISGAASHGTMAGWWPRDCRAPVAWNDQSPGDARAQGELQRKHAAIPC